MADAQTKLDRDEIKARLIHVPREQQVLFAARCALRTLPVLGNCGVDFSFWKKEQRAKHLVNVLRAINAAYSAATVAATDAVSAAASTAAVAADKAASNIDKYAHASASVVSAFDAYASAHNVHTATHLYDAYYSAVAAAHAASAYNAGAFAAASAYDAAATLYDADLYDVIADITTDLANIGSTPLWRSGQPTILATYERDLIHGMQLLGLHYWVRQYRGWVKGEFDWPQMRRCLEMPQEYTKSVEAMMGYLEAAEKGEQKYLDEARVLIIGEGAVGKTSLLNFLLTNRLADSNQSTTPGVEVREKEERIGGRNLRVHYWDFGGQLHLHPTHQFFMRSRCVYLVVVNARTENACAPQVEYWLEHVRIFGHGASALIVQNKVDEVPSGMKAQPPFDMRTIRAKYPFVQGDCLNLSCTQGEGREALRAAINILLAERRILDDKTPATWFDVKELLRKEKDPYITRKRYHELCDRSHVEKDTGRKGALDALDKLGVALHFPEVDDDLFVLKPEWVTDIVYHIINTSETEHWAGKLNTEKLKVIFDREKYPGAPEIRVDKLPAILRLLQNFELIYEMGQGDYGVPMLLDIEYRADDFPVDSSLRFTVTMPTLLPPALYYRFITQCGNAREIDGDKLWRHGCVLIRGEVRVLVEYRVSERRITLSVYGEEPQAGKYLSVLRVRLFELCGKFEGLEYEPKVSGHGFDSLPLAQLLASYQSKIPNMVDGKGEIVSVEDSVRQLYGSIPAMDVIMLERAYLLGKVTGYEKVLDRPIQIQIQNSNHVNVSLNLQLQIGSQLQDIDNALDPLRFEVGRLNGKKALLEEIDYLRNKIAEYQAIKTTTGHESEKKRKGILDIIKRYTGKVQGGLEGIKGLADLAATMKTAVDALTGLMS